MAEDVRAYYSQVTKAFLRASSSVRRTGSFHRSLRLPAGLVRSLERRGNDGGFRAAVAAEAAADGAADNATKAASGTPMPDPLNAVHHVLRGVLRRHGALDVAKPVIADLGCGIGATVDWLQRNTPADAVGITLSELQAAMAARRIGAGKVVAGSFTNPRDLERMARGRGLHGAVMIESFVHTDEPERLFGALAGYSFPGAVLVIVDDLPTERLAQLSAVPHGRHGRAEQRRRGEYHRLVEDFRRGWHVHSFLPPRSIADMAAAAEWDMVETMDLSDYIIRNRPRDLLARAAAGPARAFGLPGAWWQNVVGGSALQRLSHRGALRYQLLVLRKRG